MNKSMSNQFATTMSLGVVLIAALTACNGTAGPKIWPKTQDIPYTQIEATQIPSGYTALVFYRNADTQPEQTSVNIGLNGQYQASLQGGNYTTIMACAGNSTVSTVITGQKINDLTQDAFEFPLDEQRVYYFEVVLDAVGNAKAVPRSADEALPQLAGKSRQSHTISRVVVDNCQSAPVVAPVVTSTQPKPVVQEPIQPKVTSLYLNALVSFDFASSKVQADDVASLNRYAQDLQKSGKDFNVRILGYTDPVGSTQANYRLAEKRANNVAQVLGHAGLTSHRVEVVSGGETNLIRKDCNKYTSVAMRNQCNYDNRRVEIYATEK